MTFHEHTINVYSNGQLIGSLAWPTQDDVDEWQDTQ